jgi:hypothetical protein
MSHGTTHTNHFKIYSHLLTWLKTCLLRLGDRVFATTDADARQHGWQITPTPGGLGRRYRDPRFDTLAACEGCRGHGAKGTRKPCWTCGGIGRIVVRPAAYLPPSPPPRGLP